ncbi:MAG: carboxylating nicotinate-nucleotide diphosphorylase [Chloroflexi bacterium]|nr:carboxylating nicotinate-nucleotide diphosphorylase [Chloroflexota bacterium]
MAAIIGGALAEDLGWGDITTDFLVPSSMSARAHALVKQEGVLAGLDVFRQTFLAVDSGIRVECLAADGARVGRGDVVARLAGPAAPILRAERTALNLLQRLSGIATMTARYVEAVRDLPVRVIDTRKTTPGLRLLEKYAVRVGGGHNHRFGLSDGVLVKENHLLALRAEGLTLADAVGRLRQSVPHTVRIEVEVVTIEQAQEALEAGADVILLDNMPPERMREVVHLVGGRALTEASGGIRLANVRAVAETGVDLLSVGALTHSPQALDISLEFELT